MMTAAEKSPDAYRSIGEVARQLRLEAHVIRFWESRFDAIKPVKSPSGRRLYSPQDIELLQALQILLHKRGYSIRGVKVLLKERKREGVVAMCRPGAERDASMIVLQIKELRLKIRTMLAELS